VKKERRYLILGLLVLMSIGCVGQDYDGDGDGPPQAGDAEYPASLSLNFDGQGSVYVSMSLPDKATNSETLPAIVAQAFHCPVGAIKHPDHFVFDSSFQKNWSAARRERFRKEQDKYNRRLLTGHCNSVLAKDGLVLRGDFDYAPLIAELEQLGVDQFDLTVEVPKAKFFDYSKTNLVVIPEQTPEYLVYRIPLKDSSQAATIHLAYGLRPSDLQRALAILAAFVVVPVLLTLWMRRRALNLAKTDPPAAWFGFMRSLNWIVLASTLIWVSSGFGARKTLEEWIFQRGFSPITTAAADGALGVVPFFLVYLLCVLLSYAVHEKLRGTRWTRREFFAQQLTTVGAQMLPLMVGVTGISIMGRQPELAAGLIVSAVIAFQLLTTLKLRLMQTLPQPLTTGELRDRIFSLAQRLGVEVKQIFILPSGKGQVANAFAARNGIVMFTDYLLEHLNKREVDGVAAHELAHLSYKHPAKIGFGLLAAIFLPNYFPWLSRTIMGLLAVALGFVSDASLRSSLTLHIWRGVNQFNIWPERDLVLLIVGFAGFYLLSRHFENVADATAVRLTGDAEAQITGILKITRLGLMPIRWGKATEAWVTHPSTVHRVHRMAKAGALPDGRLQEMLRQYDAESGAAKVTAPEDRYIVSVSNDPERLQAALSQRTQNQGKLWILLLMQVVPPALCSLLITKMALHGYGAFAAYVAGIALTALLVTFSGVWLGESGREGRRNRVVQHFERGKVSAGQPGDIFVGFAPGPYPRLFGASYHWDSGFLVLSKGRLSFVGQRVKFSFTPAEIEGIVLGQGGPSWWKFRRIYLRWKNEAGQNGIFNLYSFEPGSVWSNRARVQRLYDELLAWQKEPHRYPETRAGLNDLKKLELGQVTSTSPAKLGGMSANLRVLMYLLPLALVVNMLTHVGFAYLVFSIVLLRVIQAIPYWRYRDRIPKFPEQALSQTAQVQKASASS
jgi:Zn-dependent protease with chaperone function